MLQSDEREILIDIRFEKADENLKTARLVFDASPDNAASAAYYCVLHSIQALFLQHGISTTKKRGHRSGIDLFNRNFVHAGVFSKEIGAIAGQLETMRNIGVYAIDREVSQDEALRAIADAEKFNAAIRMHVREQQQKESRKATEQNHDIKGQKEQLTQPNKADLGELESERSLQEALERLPFLDPVVKDTLKEFVLRLKEAEGENLMRVVLFGSMARGDFDEESDTDVFVLLKEGDEFQKLMEVSDICSDTSYDMAFDNPENSEQWYVLLSPLVETEQSIERVIKGIPRWRLEPVFEAIREEGVTLFDVGSKREEYPYRVFSTEITG